VGGASLALGEAVGDEGSEAADDGFLGAADGVDAHFGFASAAFDEEGVDELGDDGGAGEEAGVVLRVDLRDESVAEGVGGFLDRIRCC